MFDAIANPLRRQLVEALAMGDRAAGELATPLPVSRPAVSQHLAVLRHAGVVAEVRRGRQRRYRLRPEALAELRDWLATLDCFWAERLGALGAHLDRTP